MNSNFPTDAAPYLAIHNLLKSYYYIPTLIYK